MILKNWNSKDLRALNKDETGLFLCKSKNDANHIILAFKRGNGACSVETMILLDRAFNQTSVISVTCIEKMNYKKDRE